MDLSSKMYIIELIIKLINKRKKAPEKKVSYYTNQQTVEPEEKCDHVLRPVDSTGMVLACIKCGFVVNMYDNQNEGNLWHIDKEF